MAPDDGTRKPDGEHEERVRKAFDALHEELGGRAEGEAKESLERLREAAARRDAAGVREELGAVKERHGWLHEELTKHPQIAALVNELALWGF